MNIIIRNCRCYDKLDEYCQLWLKEGKIEAIGAQIDPPTPFEEYDARGAIIAPGLIDIHIQGAGGADVLDTNEDTILIMGRKLSAIGTTSFLATTVYLPDRDNTHLHPVRLTRSRDDLSAECLGWHLEGPFINRIKKGGISEHAIAPFSNTLWQEINQLTTPNLRMMTLAPELEGVPKLVAQLNQLRIIPSLGHTDISFENAQQYIGREIHHVTHIFNAMRGFTHREPGPLAAIARHNSVTVQLIADGVHVHPGAIRMLFQLIGPQRIICITDGVRTIGMPDGEYEYGGRKFISLDGAARYEDGTLIGCSLSLLEIVRRFRSSTQCSIRDAINTASYNPALLLGIENRKGVLKTGADADLILIDDSLQLIQCWIRGKKRQNF